MNLSLVVPVFNKEDALPLTLDSISRMLDAYKFVIFVDDCSTDNSYNIIESFIKNTGRSNIKIIRLASNSGPFAARMAGISKCDTQFVQLLDADDLLISAPDIHPAYEIYSLIFFHQRLKCKKVIKSHFSLVHSWPHSSSIIVNKAHALKPKELLRLDWGEDHVYFSQLLSFGPFLYIPGNIGEYKKYPNTRGNRNASLNERFLCSKNIIVNAPSLILSSYLLAIAFFWRSLFAYIYKHITKKYNSNSFK